MKYANVHEAKTHLSRILKEVAAGEEYVIGKAGEGLARLIPLEKGAEKRTPGLYKDRVQISEDFDEALPELSDLFTGDAGEMM